MFNLTSGFRVFYVSIGEWFYRIVLKFPNCVITIWGEEIMKGADASPFVGGHCPL